MTYLNFFENSTDSDRAGKTFRDIIFEVIVASKIYNRFNSWNLYWENLELEKKIFSSVLVTLK